ncbi:MAG: hypothetical protein AB8H79_14755, partial [Myxococcota bacterium]
MQIEALVRIDRLYTELKRRSEVGPVIALLEAEGLHSLLDATPSVVGLQRRWNRWYSGEDTVRSALEAREVPLTPRERGRLASEARFRSLLAVVGGRPGADSTPDDVLTWMQNRNLSWLAEAPIGANLPSWPALQDEAPALEHWTWADVFDLPRSGSAAPLSGGSTEVSRSLLETLGRVLAHHYVLQLDEAAMLAGVDDRPAELPAAFSSFWTDAAEQLTRLASGLDEAVGPLS